MDDMQPVQATLHISSSRPEVVKALLQLLGTLGVDDVTAERPQPGVQPGRQPSLDEVWLTETEAKARALRAHTSPSIAWSIASHFGLWAAFRSCSWASPNEQGQFAVLPPELGQARTIRIRALNIISAADFVHLARMPFVHRALRTVDGSYLADWEADCLALAAELEATYGPPQAQAATKGAP